MTCVHCKGVLVRGAAPFSIDRKGVHVHWEAVAAWVCEQCGEPVFEEAEVDRILNALVVLEAGAPPMASHPSA